MKRRVLQQELLSLRNGCRQREKEKGKGRERKRKGKAEKEESRDVCCKGERETGKEEDKWEKKTGKRKG